MLKKNMTWITFVLAGLILVLGYFLYQEYLAPLYLNNVGETTTVSLSADQHVVLVKNPEQENVFSVELEISGKSKDILEILISNPSKTSAYSARIKGGDVDFTYVTNWFEDTCLLDIHPVQSSSDKIIIESRFIGTK
jgi:hypothetical protein